MYNPCKVTTIYSYSQIFCEKRFGRGLNYHDKRLLIILAEVTNCQTAVKYAKYEPFWQPSDNEPVVCRGCLEDGEMR